MQSTQSSMIQGQAKQDDFRIIDRWCEFLRMSLNIEKYEASLFGWNKILVIWWVVIASIDAAIWQSYLSRDGWSRLVNQRGRSGGEGVPHGYHAVRSYEILVIYQVIVVNMVQSVIGPIDIYEFKSHTACFQHGVSNLACYGSRDQRYHRILFHLLSMGSM